MFQNFINFNRRLQERYNPLFLNVDSNTPMEVLLTLNWAVRWFNPMIPKVGGPASTLECWWRVPGMVGVSKKKVCCQKLAVAPLDRNIHHAHYTWSVSSFDFTVYPIFIWQLLWEVLRYSFDMHYKNQENPINNGWLNFWWGVMVVFCFW